MSPDPEQKNKGPLSTFLQLVRKGQIRTIGSVIIRRMKSVPNKLEKLTGKLYNLPMFYRLEQSHSLISMLESNYDYSPVRIKPGSIKVAMIAQEGTTHPKSSAFIRLIGPLTQIPSKDKINLTLCESNTVKLDGKYDVCIVQRAAMDDVQSAQALVKNLKASGTKLIVDTDDAFHAIDKSHPEYQTQLSKVGAIDYLVAAADEVWVSTQQLKAAYTTNPSVVVIENCLDERLWRRDTDYKKLPAKNTELQILYMGTASHDSDLAMILPALDKLASTIPDSFKLTLVGVASSVPERPWIQKLPQNRLQAIYPGFVDWFLQQGPFDIGLSPLVDSPFNKSKSDIKCLDYLAAGILPVVSDVEAYNNKDIVNFVIKAKNSSDDWYNVLLGLAKDLPSTRKRISEVIPAAQQYIWTQRNSKVASKKILDQIETLVGRTNDSV